MHRRTQTLRFVSNFCFKFQKKNPSQRAENMHRRTQTLRFVSNFCFKFQKKNHLQGPKTYIDELKRFTSFLSFSFRLQKKKQISSQKWHQFKTGFNCSSFIFVSYSMVVIFFKNFAWVIRFIF